MVVPGGRASVVYVTGDLDVATTASIRCALIETVFAHSRVIVDLSGLDFCDCAGLSALVAARNAARQRDTTLTIRNIPAQLAQLLDLVPQGDPFATSREQAHWAPEVPCSRTKRFE
ncbi:STAS domain-containing protein [Streptomyces sp. NPDC099088]|uniref:STAS domain-containing protein n=1 Tax=Streptomyces sp. NPDC099088 TaxID=3366101 RepID=UPI0038287D56